ncbi:MAG: dephospho-CoA kinase [Clostridium sp.]|nr:dephospho-CoA kinase [Clostridium sp.]
MLCVGLTGGIGTGKSTVSGILKEKSINVIDADDISRKIYDIYPNLLKEIENEFGGEYFNEDGSLNRRKLGDHIFTSEVYRKNLEKIVMPSIKREIKKHIKLCEEVNEKICVIDAPTLIENGLSRDMDINILVWVDEKTQIDRVMKRDNMTREQVTQRIKAQMSVDKKKKYVDFIIDTSKEIENTQRQIDKIIAALKVL